eukprot:1527606-Alexandrium_andersonii.AAC.1
MISPTRRFHRPSCKETLSALEATCSGASGYKLDPRPCGVSSGGTWSIARWRRRDDGSATPPSGCAAKSRRSCSDKEFHKEETADKAFKSGTFWATKFRHKSCCSEERRN